ncbi:hypothetical protein Cni_G12611 [Canna indica]|uniref:DUF4228 domain protein n=1 Tax=Canna indica TaxID=4628 RepID=A0AAQ3Q964_9LILI|nr:hypothetical protein Cni_G12611 [Canna indica]
MGLKPLSLQMIVPWCFHVAGAAFSTDEGRGSRAEGASSVRLVGPDGRIRLYRRRVSAAELMAVHPLHLLCRSDALVIGQPVPSLSPADRLLPGATYFLLPAHLFRSPLSFASLAACLSDLKRAGGGAALLRPIEIQKTAGGRLQVRVSDEYLEKLRRAEEEEEAAERRGRRVCTTEALAKDYKQLVRCRSWKPKLETIKESERRRKTAGATFGGMGRRKKKNPTMINSTNLNVDKA